MVRHATGTTVTNIARKALLRAGLPVGVAEPPSIASAHLACSDCPWPRVRSSSMAWRLHRRRRRIHQPRPNNQINSFHALIQNVLAMKGRLHRDAGTAEMWRNATVSRANARRYCSRASADSGSAAGRPVNVGPPIKPTDGGHGQGDRCRSYRQVTVVGPTRATSVSTGRSSCRRQARQGSRLHGDRGNAAAFRMAPSAAVHERQAPAQIGLKPSHLSAALVSAGCEPDEMASAGLCVLGLLKRHELMLTISISGN